MTEQDQLLIALWEEIQRLKRELAHIKNSYAINTLADMEHAGISEVHPNEDFQN